MKKRSKKKPSFKFYHHQLYIPILLVLSFASLALLWIFSTGATGYATYSFGNTVPQGFGVPWNLFSSQHENLLDSSDNTINVKATFVYKWGYIWDHNVRQWKGFEFPQQKVFNNWVAREASFDLNSLNLVPGEYSVVAYTCQYVNNEWKCGCRTSQCRSGVDGGMWQIQKVDIISGITKVGTVTYRDGDAFIGENKNNPKWVWNLEGLTTSNPTLGVENDWKYRGVSDRDTGVSSAIGVRQCTNLPNNYITICFADIVGLNENIDNYAISFEENIDLSGAGGRFSTYIARNVITISSNTQSIDLHSSASHVVTNYVALVIDDLDSNKINLFYKGSRGFVFFSDLANSKVALSNDWSNDLRLDLMSGSGDLYSLHINSPVDVISALFRASGGRGFSSLGSTRGYEESGELVWQSDDPNTGVALYSLNIGAIDADLRTLYGVVIKNPRGNGASDEISLEVPSKQLRGIIEITSPSLRQRKEIALGGSIGNNPLFSDSNYGLLTFSRDSPSLETSLSSSENDYGRRIFMEVDVDSIAYTSRSLDLSRLRTASPQNPVTINHLLGRDITITGVTDNSITVLQ